MQLLCAVTVVFQPGLKKQQHKAKNCSFPTGHLIHINSDVKITVLKVFNKAG